MISRMSFSELYHTDNLFHICEKDFNHLEIPYYPAVHWHDYTELEIVVEGECTNYINDAEYRLKRGDAFVTSYYDLHNLLPDEGLKMINISFHNNFLDNNLTNMITSSNGSLLHKFSAEDMSTILSLCNITFDAQNNPSPISEMSAKYAVSNILMLIIKNSKCNVSVTPRKIQTIVEYINNNLTSDLSLALIADKFFMSSNHLGKLFKNTMHISYNSYINKIRVRYACKLITSTSMNFGEIALAVGYSSPEYFFYSFKKQMNITPTEYRANSSHNKQT